jgi:hypothetical protein
MLYFRPPELDFYTSFSRHLTEKKGYGIRGTVVHSTSEGGVERKIIDHKKTKQDKRDGTILLG